MTVTPDAIVPDTKDWTWVLERPCPDCGFDARRPEQDQLADLLAANGEAWRAFLAAAPHAARRPNPSTWSALEYGCHVRDVYLLGDARLAAMIDRPGAVFADWDQDAAARDGGYHREVPVQVALGIAAAASRVAYRLEAVTGAVWLHAGRRSNGSVFTVESFARYLLHDPVHHLWDVGAGTA